jgi:large subunit ribosomal protein L28
MSRRCIVTGKAVHVGHNVSHANNKTKRRFLPNLQVVSMLSDALNQSIRLRLSARGIKTIEASGGLDAWILKARDGDLDLETRRLKRRIRKAADKRTAAAA